MSFASSLAQNHAIEFMGLLNRLIYSGGAYLEADHKRLLLFSVETTALFMMGRDTDNVPFIGVPVEMQPYFSQIDWGRLSLLRSQGYVFLEVFDPKTSNLLFALGFRIRKDRQSMFCLDGVENPNDMYLNLKTFTQKPGENAIVQDRNDITRIAIREIASVDEMDNQMNADDAEDLFQNSGASSSVSIVRLGRNGRT